MAFVHLGEGGYKFQRATTLNANTNAFTKLPIQNDVNVYKYSRQQPGC